jgi:SAM-dependent methyltransferase
MEYYKNHIEKSFQNAEQNISKITQDILNIEGSTGIKTRHFYNNLLSMEDARYLEIGPWKGSSVCSAMYGNKADVVCIDNWSEFGGPKAEFLNNFEKYKGENEVSFIEYDCSKFNIYGLSIKFNIYMYDGNYLNENRHKALMHYYEILNDIFIMIINDWNCEDVQKGTYNTIKELRLTLLYENERKMDKTWGNGIYVAVLKKHRPHNSLQINYKTIKTELCEIGRLYDTDKSSQRNNVTDTRHCHPYTIFYDSLFKHKRNETLQIAELGILEGSSLRMWQEYFVNSNIYGFDFSNEQICRFKELYNNERIYLSHLDVTNKDSIIHAFQQSNQFYDIIIEDTTHQFEDQIRVIENVYSYLKPGGILVIEDIFKSYNENDYITRLQPILHHFQDYYFVSLDHVNRVSTGWDNDKLFILVKGGAEPIFRNKNKLTIITPSYRVDNLHKLKKSINFDYVKEWIIVYDGSKISKNPNLFINNNENGKIKEYIYNGKGISGNPQRNYALSQITDENTLLYYLDDDNIMHPNLYSLLNVVDENKIYTFNQENRLLWTNTDMGNLDTAMFMIDYRLCKNIKWINHSYEADWKYIKECYELNDSVHVWVDNDLCYYNKLNFM